MRSRGSTFIWTHSGTSTTDPMDAFFEIVPVMNFGTGTDLRMEVEGGIHYFFD